MRIKNNWFYYTTYRKNEEFTQKHHTRVSINRKWENIRDNDYSE